MTKGGASARLPPFFFKHFSPVADVGGDHSPLGGIMGLTNRPVFRRLLRGLLLILLVALPLEMEAAELRFVTVNDFHGAIKPREDGRGGLSRIASVVKSARESSAAGGVPFMALNLGDNVVFEEDARTYRLFGGEPEFYGMTLAGIDLAIPGNHDFALGTDFFADALEHAGFDLLCTNFLEERSDRLAERFLPYKVVDFDGLRVGFFGLLIAAYDSRDYASDNYMTIAREVVRLLREEERCTVVIALSHLGYLWDRELAGAVDGIDVICGGHTHLALKRPAVVNGTAIVHGGAYGQQVGELSLFVDDAGEVVSLDWELRAIDGTVPDDEEVLAFLEPFWDAYPGKEDSPASAGGGGCSMTFAPALIIVPLLLLQGRSGLGRR